MRNDTLKFLGDNLVPILARLSITAFLFGQGVFAPLPFGIHNPDQSTFIIRQYPGSAAISGRFNKSILDICKALHSEKARQWNNAG